MPPKRVGFGYLLVASAACLWGFWPVFLRSAEAFGGLPPAFEAAVMFAVVAIFTGPLVLRDRVAVKAPLRGWLGVVWLGVSDAFNTLLLFRAYQLTSVAIAVLTHYLTPIFVALAAPWVLGEKRDARTRIAIAVSFSGLVLLLEPWRDHLRITDVLGALCGAGSAAFYASNVLVNKRLAGSFSGSELTFYHALIALPVLALAVPVGAWSTIDLRGATYMAGGSLIAGVLGSLFFVWGLRRVRASHASNLTLLEPLVAVIVGALLYDEKLTPLALLGGVFILAGALTVVARPRAEKPAQRVRAIR